MRPQPQTNRGAPPNARVRRPQYDAYPPALLTPEPDEGRGMGSARTPWAVLLAGGDGTRLQGEAIAGRLVDRPKQFLHLDHGTSLLGSTLRRALRVVETSNLVPVVSSAHRTWWTADLADIPAENILVQPLNRGTAPALLLALLHVLRRGRDPTILVFPSDHGVEDEIALASTLRGAIAFIAEHGDDLVLLGARPTHPETQYGWIVPGGRMDGSPRPVRQFIEKPSPEVALSLMEQGALWNTFIFAASGTALLKRFLRVAPHLVRSSLWHMGRNGWSEDSLHQIYRSLAPLDFSRDVLQPSAEHVQVIRLPSCGWTDLGTSRRVAEWIDRQRDRRSGVIAEPVMTAG